MVCFFSVVSFEVISPLTLSFTPSGPPLAFLLGLPQARHELNAPPPPPPNIWMVYSFTLPGSLLKWYLPRGSSLTTASKISFPSFLACLIFPHSIYNLIYIKLFVCTLPHLTLTLWEQELGPFCSFWAPSTERVLSTCWIVKKSC